VTAASREAALGSTRSRNEDRHRQYVRHDVRTNPPPRARTATHGTVPTVNGPGRMIRTGRAETSAREDLRQQSIATPRGEFTFAKCGRRKSHRGLGRREGPEVIAPSAMPLPERPSRTRAATLSSSRAPRLCRLLSCLWLARLDGSPATCTIGRVRHFDKRIGEACRLERSAVL
jgi:hypothetical protein